MLRNFPLRQRCLSQIDSQANLQYRDRHLMQWVFLRLTDKLSELFLHHQRFERLIPVGDRHQLYCLQEVLLDNLALDFRCRVKIHQQLKD